MGRIRELEDVAIADCALEIEAADLGDLFVTAARALAEVTVDPDTLGGSVSREIRLEADALDLLLFDFLSELIFLRDAEGIVLVDGAVTVGEGTPCRLTARLHGGAIDPATTRRRADPKAVTFHRLAVERDGAGWIGRVVVDI